MFDDGVGGVVVDGFKVFGGDAVRLDARVGVQAGGDVAHDVFDEFRVFVGALGDVFFVRPFQRRPDFAGAFFFADADEVFKGKRRFFVVFGVDDDVRALVVRAVFGDFFGAGAEAGDGDGDFDADDAVLHAAVGDEGHFVIEQAFGFADRRLFFHKVGEGEDDAAFGGVQPLQHFRVQRGEAVEADGARFVQQVDEARHMRAFLLVRQGDGHLCGGDGRLRAVRRCDVQRDADVADADAGNGDVAGIGFSLDVRDGRLVHGVGFRVVKSWLLSFVRQGAAMWGR